jgi:hypothetical protein
VTENEKLRALLAEALDQHAHCLPCVPDCVWTRIEAALAEPVDAMQAAEIDREHWTYKVLSQGLEIEAKKIREGMVRQAYQRGAEAMREAAADYIRRTGWDMNPQVSCSVRTLPIPEDKP